MMPTYKRTKVFKEACPKCGEFLERVYSNHQTWKCSCGAWCWDFLKGNYEIIPTTSHANSNAIPA